MSSEYLIIYNKNRLNEFIEKYSSIFLFYYYKRWI